MEDGGRADPVFRRRPGRAEGGVSRRRPGAAAARARQKSSLRAAAGRAGPRRSRALRRARGDRGSDRGGARACRHDLVARDRRRQLCYARAARGAGGADRRDSPAASATKWCGAIIARIWPSGCSGRLRRKPPAAATAAAIFAARRAANYPAASPRAPPGGPGRFGRPQAGSAPSLGRGPYQAVEPPACLEPDHARPAQRAVPPRGADFADPDQPPLAAARSSGGSRGAGIGPPRGPQTARRHHRGLRQRPSPFARARRAGREDAGRPRGGRIFTSSSKG